ncbi:MAG: toxin-antitoxin system YwqK family antitoxin [Flavobacteriaceae bacterium]|nr:toxin-antitoxin system YwqK family antitoxin [Flavobacteriaceae bacterium]
MKKNIFLAISVLFFYTLSLCAQNDTIWYDANWQNTKKENAQFYRAQVIKKDNGYWFVDSYISDAKQMEGLSLKKDEEVYQGVVKWYHENGNIFQVVNYDNGVLNGKRQVYYESGKLKSEGNYKQGKREGAWKELHENGKTKETGTYENGQKEGVWKTYYPNGKLKEEGKYVFDKKVDVWKTNYYDGNVENQ